MKKFKLFKMLAVLVVLITSINTAWAGNLCGFCDKAEVTDAVYIKYSKNGGSATQQNLAGSGQGDITLGTVTSLTITEFRGITKKHDGNVCAVRLYYKTATTGDIEIGSDNYKSAEYNNSGYPDWTWDSYWLCEQYKNSSVGLNILNGLAPGSYWFNFYFSIYGNNNSNSGCWDHQAYWSNGSKNYHMSFTVPSKNLTVAGAANGNTVSGDQTGISSGTAYTITATPAPGYKFNGWTATSGSSSISIADASSATTTVTFNNYANDATVTASFVRTYAFIEGRFQIKNAARNSTTTTYDDGGQWASGSTKIIMSYDGGNKRHELHTYMTPSELSANHGTSCDDCKPYFFIKTSTDDESLIGVTQYWAPNESTTISGTGTGSGATLTHTGDLDDNNLRISSSDVSGYAVLYFDESKVWYELEQTLNYASNGGSGAAPAEAYHMKNSTTSAAAANTFTAPTGYHFDHWAGSNSTNYNAGATVTMSANLTLTAQWEPNTFKVTFNANGGDGEMADQNFTYNATQALTANAFTKAGFYFEGWATASDGSVAYRNRADGCNISSTNGATVPLYAKWKEISSIATDCWDNEGKYTCGSITDLATPKPAATASWSSVTWGGGTPDINDQVVIPANMAMTVDDAHAKAKQILLGASSTLTIDPNKGLEVAGTIKKADGSAPTASDLTLASTSSGNASLIFNNSNGAQATVQMYSKASVVGDTWNWQFIGIPYTSVNALQYYGSYLFKWLDDGTGWDEVGNGETLSSFKGYCITNKSANETYTMTGTLDRTDTKELTISIPAGKEFVIGNSWTAPIDIGTFTDDAFDISNKVVYLFNTGYAPDPESPATAGTSAGQYIAVPIHASPFTGYELIAPMQGFYVDNTGGSAGSITIDYATVVRPTRVRNIVAGPMYAPKRVKAEADPAVMKIKATGSRYTDRVVILAREDFSTGFDNGWDGKNINEPGVAPIIYALRADGTKDAVSAIPTYEGTVVGFRQGEDSQYTFSFEYNGEEEWYLNDLKEENSTLITTENTYAFTTDENEDAEARFAISKTPIKKITTGVDEVESGVKARKQIINGTLYIIRDGRIYNAEGAVVK